MLLMMISMIQKILLLTMLSWLVSLTVVGVYQPFFDFREAVTSSTIIVQRAFLSMKRFTSFVKIFLLQDEYFEVDNSAIKHDGFFVNRGELERM